jgi:PPOX class probable F420-dependent enzyme
MNRRKQIELTPEERTAFVATQQTIHLCSNGPHGYPHVVPMWFVADDDGTLWMTTFGKSQKALNLRRDPKVAAMVESGVTYDTLKGVYIRGEADIIPDVELCVTILKRIQEKTTGAAVPGIEDALRHQARKRVAIKITPNRYASWDHAKLGGVY